VFTGQKTQPTVSKYWSTVQALNHTEILTLAPFNPHPDGCIGPLVDAILLCFSPVLRRHPRWCPYHSDLVWQCPSSFPWPSRLSLVPLSSRCTAWRGILESSILNTYLATAIVYSYSAPQTPTWRGWARPTPALCLRPRSSQVAFNDFILIYMLQFITIAFHHSMQQIGDHVYYRSGWSVCHKTG